MGSPDGKTRLASGLRHMTRFKRDWLTAFPVALGVVGALLILLRQTTYGIGLNWDSRRYISAAQNLLDGNGLVTSLDRPYQSAGPLFPVTLAIVARLFGLEVMEAASYANAAAFGLTVFVVSLWLKGRVQSPVLAVWAGCACILSIRLALFGACALTDMLFILLVVVSLFALDRFLGTGNRSLLFLAAVSAAAACLTRYIGVTLIGTGLLVLVFQRNTVVTKMTNAAVWFVVAAVPFSLWALRNVFVIGTFLGKPGPNGFSALISLHVATDEMTRWIFGETGFHFLNGIPQRLAGVESAGDVTTAAVVLKIAVLLMLVIGVGYALAYYRPGFLGRNRDILTVSIVFLSVYALFLMIYLPLADVTLPSRYMQPMFPPLLVAATIILGEFISNSHASRPPSLKKMITGKLGWILVSLWLVLQVGANYDDIREWIDNGVGYNSRQWAESELVRYLKAHPPARPIVSNAAPLFYFLKAFRDGETIGLGLRFSDVKYRLDNRRRHPGGEEIVFAVFYRDFWRRNYDYDLQDLGALPGMEVAAILEDGVIFQSRPPSDSGSAAQHNDSVVRAFHALLKDARPVIRSHFDVYLDEKHNRLIYVRDACGDGDAGYTGPRFFLHIFPVDPADLPGHRQRDAFDAFDFSVNHYGGSIGWRCIAMRSLPAYAIAAIETGQFDRRGDIWKGTFTFSDARRSLHTWQSPP